MSPDQIAGMQLNNLKLIFFVIYVPILELLLWTGILTHFPFLMGRIYG
jgi:hypothetical protein